MSSSEQLGTKLGRRAFLEHGTLILAAAAVGGSTDLRAAEPAKLRVGLITDLHHADKAPAGTRHYRETLSKLQEAGEHFRQSQADFVVELGDLIDAAATVETELAYLKTINREFSAIHKNRHYVLGNHCVDTLTKDEFLGGVEQPKSYYSFDRAGIHFIVLDACFRSDGQPYGRKNSKWSDANIPPAELEWLAADLKANDRPVVVFAHQRLDVSNDHGVKNCAEIRKLFESSSGKVLAVFQGHSHQNELKDVNGIHYVTLLAMIEGSGAENNGYSLLDITPTGTLYLHGFRKQRTHDWRA